MSPNDGQFSMHAKRYFLTYSRCDLLPAVWLERFRLGETIPFNYIVGREKHTDEGEGPAHHLHVYLEYERPKRVRDARYFDVGDHHPNVQSVRNARAVQDYCTKDGDYITSMDLAVIRRTYGEIVASSRSEEEFLAKLEESYARDVVLNLERIRAFARWKWGPKHELYTATEETFVVPEFLQNWYEDNVLNQLTPGR